MQYDVYRLKDGGIVVDCQSDLIGTFETRFVIPLVPADMPVTSLARLHPRMEIDGKPMILATHLAAAVPVSALGPVIDRVEAQSWTITAALDMLTGGF